jgi:hypothetical protein
MKLDQSIINELTEIEREKVLVSESADLAWLQRARLAYEQRRARRAELNRRTQEVCDRASAFMSSTEFSVHRAIARAEAEAIEWRAFAERNDEPSAEADSDGTLRRPAPPEGETRRREAAGE